MSLTKQLWIAIVIVLIIALSGTFVISTLAARHYLQQQLYLKNQDNVSSLALSISQLDKDPATLELLVSAQFDSGHYQFIRIADQAGTVLIERDNPPLHLAVPDWFQQLVPITIEPGTAPIQNGWELFGTLTLQSHSRFAYEALWRQTKNLLVWFIAGFLFCGWVGSEALRRITTPLHEVIDQAEAIGDRRFIRIIEPKTLEFRSLVSAMNRLSDRIQRTLSEEANRLEQLRFEAHHDTITGLLNREPFISQLKSTLEHDDDSSSGVLIIARLSALDELNQALGRHKVDDLLHTLGQCLLSLTQSHPGWIAGRLNGSDLALLACGARQAETVTEQVAEILQRIMTDLDYSGERLLPLGATTFEPGDQLSVILSRTDNALSAAEQKGSMASHITYPQGYRVSLTDQTAWHEALDSALKQKQITLGQYPAIDSAGRLLHMEAPARVLIEGDWRNAGLIVPSAAQSGLLPLFDQCVFDKALEKISTDNIPLGINLSRQAIRDTRFCAHVARALRTNPAQAEKLWLEIPEYGAYRELDAFKQFCNQVKAHGGKIGLEHVGNHFVRISELHDLGLDYIKIDAALIRDIDSNAANQTIVRNLCTIAHTIGLIVIAEGVQSQGEKITLPELGLDGLTGPAISLKS
ncbi:MAG: EAL domain-containing protein [Desulfuromonadaceae bacterium]|nr:EAL domain-containing protein [Desulfuromonadaceae bacterium]